MRINSIIIIFVIPIIVCLSCKSDKVSNTISIPYIQGVWESKSAVYPQASAIQENYQAVNDGGRFDTVYKTANHITMVIDVNNNVLVKYKNGIERKFKLRYHTIHTNEGNSLIVAWNETDKEWMTFNYTKKNKSLSCDWRFTILEIDNCVLPINEYVLVNFIQE